MRAIGPEGSSDRKLRAWFDEQEKHNLERLEDGAKSITQLVTGLYSILFAVLALSNQPAYLKRPTVQWLGGLGTLAFFAALLFSLVTLFPWHNIYQEDNLSDLERVHRRILNRKLRGLRMALGAFLVGSGFLMGMIVAILWGW